MERVWHSAYLAWSRVSESKVIAEGKGLTKSPRWAMT